MLLVASVSRAVLKALQQALGFTKPTQPDPDERGRPGRVWPGEFEVVFVDVFPDQRKPRIRSAVLALLGQCVGGPVRERRTGARIFDQRARVERLLEVEGTCQPFLEPPTRKLSRCGAQ